MRDALGVPVELISRPATSGTLSSAQWHPLALPACAVAGLISLSHTHTVMCSRLPAFPIARDLRGCLCNVLTVGSWHDLARKTVARFLERVLVHSVGRHFKQSCRSTQRRYLRSSRPRDRSAFSDDVTAQTTRSKTTKTSPRPICVGDRVQPVSSTFPRQVSVSDPQCCCRVCRECRVCVLHACAP